MDDNPGRSVEDQRTHLRIRTVHSIMYRKANDSRAYEASTTDLSLTGAAIETAYPLTKGELLEVHIAFGSKQIPYSAEVVHVEQVREKRLRAGLRFRDVSEGKRRLLKRHLSRISLETRSFFLDGTLLEMIRQLNTALADLKLYGVGHPSTANAIERSYNSLIRILERKSELALKIVDNTLVVDQQPLGRGNALVFKFIEELETRNIRTLVFSTGLLRKEFEVFVSCMNRTPNLLMADGGAERLLEKHSVSHLLVN